MCPVFNFCLLYTWLATVKLGIESNIIPLCLAIWSNGYCSKCFAMIHFCCFSMSCGFIGNLSTSEVRVRTASIHYPSHTPLCGTSMLSLKVIDYNWLRISGIYPFSGPTKIWEMEHEGNESGKTSCASSHRVFSIYLLVTISQRWDLFWYHVQVSLLGKLILSLEGKLYLFQVSNIVKVAHNRTSWQETSIGRIQNHQAPKQL